LSKKFGEARDLTGRRFLQRGCQESGDADRKGWSTKIDLHAPQPYPTDPELIVRDPCIESDTVEARADRNAMIVERILIADGQFVAIQDRWAASLHAPAGPINLLLGLWAGGALPGLCPLALPATASAFPCKLLDGRDIKAVAVDGEKRRGGNKLHSAGSRWPKA
jgi:hypothetical protein